MVNKNELLVLKKYESQGWKVIRGGAPDFLMLKVNNDKIEDFLFVEVKNPNSELTYEQAIYREILENRLNAKYIIELSDSRLPTPPHPPPHYPIPIDTSPCLSIPSHTLNPKR